MGAMIILEGPREERTNEQARARVPMNAAQVRCIIDKMEMETKSKRAKINMAELAIKRGLITPDARVVWDQYLSLLTGGPVK